MGRLGPAFARRLQALRDRFSADRRLAARAFDAAWYRRTYPDVAAVGADPLAHFLAFGWREGRDPSPRFSVQAYLNAHPDLGRTGENPLLHFLKNGGVPSDPPKEDLGFRYEIVARLAPVEQRLAAVRKPADTTPPAVLETALRRGRAGLRDLHVSFSHDDYTANVGGVQLGLLRESARLAELGRDHLHLFPAKPWPVVRAAGEPGPLGVLWNGEAVGVFASDTIAAALKAACAWPAAGRSFAIHSLLGHEVDETVRILEAAGLSAGFFWLHDFASLCAGYHLLRDDVEDCAAPPPDSAACGICVYGPWRARHLTAHEALFRRLKLTVVSPSQPTLDLWRQAWDFPVAGTLVHPHARLVAGEPAPVADGRPLRVAYAGLPTGHKGWDVFAGLVERFGDDPDLEFVHLGARPHPNLPVAFREVAVGPGRPRAMQEALEAAEADVALVWPLCRETFSFVAYEAVAAGCAILTNPDSGNVAAFVRDGGHGQVLADEAALHAAFETGAVRALARTVRKPLLHDLAFSALTADLVREEHPA